MGTGGADLNKLRCRSDAQRPDANRIATVGFPRALPSLARAPSYEWPDIFFQERPSPIAWLPPGKLTHRSRAGACHAGGERTTGGAHQFWGCSRSPLLPLQAGLTCLWESLRRAYVPIAASGASSASKDLDPIRRSVLAAGAPFFRSPTVRMPAVTARSAHRRAAFQNISRCRAQQKRLGEPPRRGVSRSPHHRQHVCTAIESAATCFKVSVSRLRVGHQCTIGGSGPTGPSTLSAEPAPYFSSNAARRSGFAFRYADAAGGGPAACVATASLVSVPA